MSSGNTHAYILARDDAITEWRSLMGPTKVFRTRFLEPDSLRGLFGLTDTRNTSHGSDSEASARSEIGFFFPEFDWDRFGAEEEEAFRAGRVRLDREHFVHRKVSG